MNNLKKGFTLVELLIVVGIIGILMSVVLIALNSARNQGNDAAVKSNLAIIKSQAELFASDNNSSFLPTGGIPIGINSCPTYAPGGTNMLAKDKTINDAIQEAIKRGTGTSACYNSSSAWAIAVSLKTGGATGDLVPDSWCVDSAGSAKFYAWTSGQTILNSINVTVCR